jgi:hypothetical protein
VGSLTVIFQPLNRRETHILFFSEKSFLEFRSAFFIAFAERVFGCTVRADCLFFSARAGQEQAREAFISGPNEPPRRTAHIKTNAKNIFSRF